MSKSPNTPLCKLRVLLNLDGKQVADAVGIEQSTYSKIETGYRGYRPSSQAAERLVEYFGPPLTEEAILYPERFPRFLELGKEFRVGGPSTGVKKIA